MRQGCVATAGWPGQAGQDRLARTNSQSLVSIGLLHLIREWDTMKAARKAFDIIAAHGGTVLLPRILEYVRLGRVHNQIRPYPAALL